jgi:hypothetical protein
MSPDRHAAKPLRACIRGNLQTAIAARASSSAIIKLLHTTELIGKGQTYGRVKYFLR